MPYEWTLERIARLKDLWQDGMSSRDIAQKMGEGLTRNAVIGKANRLGLSVSGRAKVNSKASEVKKVVVLPPDTSMRKKCQWPFGDPAKDNFYFCGQPTLESRPYCKEHCALAYRRSVSGKASAPQSA